MDKWKDPYVIGQNILRKIEHLELSFKPLKDRAEAAARAEALYEKILGSAVAKLENGIEFKVDDVTIKHTVAATIDRKAKAVCWKEKLAMLEAQQLYKAAVKMADICCAQLNGWQSLNRHLDKV